MIRFQHVSKWYGRHPGVRDLSFQVESGEIVGFLGPNGAGKTTTMRLLTGYMPPTSGRLTVAGYDALEDPVELKRRVGYLPERPPLYESLTVAEQLGFIAGVRGVGGRDWLEERDELLAAVGIGDVRDRLIANLSKGYRQRVGLAQALIGDPELLVLDEPTIGLDPKQIRQIRSLIARLAGRRTVMLSTHILPEVELLCDRVLVIHRGRLVADDDPASLAERAGAELRFEAVVEAPTAELEAELEELADVKSWDIEPVSGGAGRVRCRVTAADAAAREAFSQRLAARGWPLLAIETQRASLEDVFVQLVTDESSEAAAGSESRRETADG